MTLAALGQAAAERARTMARTLGYGPVAAWLKAVFPRVYPQIRLPVSAVIACAVPDDAVPLLLGPHAPAPLALPLLRRLDHPTTELPFPIRHDSCRENRAQT